MCSRHRTGWKQGNGRLREELRKDVMRLWIRNIGRDDRCVADHGKETRHPYLDEDVMAYLRTVSTDILLDEHTNKIPLRKASPAEFACSVCSF